MNPSVAASVTAAGRGRLSTTLASSSSSTEVRRCLCQSCRSPGRVAAATGVSSSSAARSRSVSSTRSAQSASSPSTPSRSSSAAPSPSSSSLSLSSMSSSVSATSASSARFSTAAGAGRTAAHGSAHNKTLPPFAFAFDIDGVLLRSKDPIPGAANALRHLHAQGVPLLLLTNGGGRPEADRVADVCASLGLDADDEGLSFHNRHSAVVSTANFVQSHTPFQELLDDAAALDEGPADAHVDDLVDEDGSSQMGEEDAESLKAAAALAEAADSMDKETAAGAGAGAEAAAANGTAPRRKTAAGLRDQTVLVTGSDPVRIRTIAEEVYGFRSVVTPADLVAAYPSLYPFAPAAVTAETPDSVRPLPKPLLLDGDHMEDDDARLDPEKHLRIAAAFIFNDPRDWSVDLQLLMDLLQSRKGFLGTFDRRTHDMSAANAAAAGAGTPRIFFSNADLLWSTTYHLPRIGQGAFAAAVAGVWARLAAGPAGSEQQHEQHNGQHKKTLSLLHPAAGRTTLLGKPHPATYRYAERVLLRYRETLRQQMLKQQEKKLVAAGPASSATAASVASPPLQTVYMIGDNPASDIAGANQFTRARGASADWVSVLVKTGVYNPERDGEAASKLDPTHRPKTIVPDVAAAVQWALRREGWPAEF